MKGPVLVTGADSYIGGRLVPFLSQQKINLRLTPWQHDLPEEALYQLCNNVQTIIHLATPAPRVTLSQAATVGTVGTARLMEAAERAGVKQFMLVSTSRVYGPEARGITNEDSLPRPLDADAVATLGAEHYVLNAQDRWALTGIVARVSDAIGPPATANSDGWTLPQNDLCRHAALKKRYDVRTDAVGLRDFIPVTDVCRAIQHLLELSIEELDDGLFNVCSGVAMTMTELAAMVAATSQEALRHKPEVTAPIAVIRDITFELSNEKLRLTGFQPSVSVEDEVKATVAGAAKAFAAP